VRGRGTHRVGVLSIQLRHGRAQFRVVPAMPAELLRAVVVQHIPAANEAAGRDKGDGWNQRMRSCRSTPSARADDASVASVGKPVRVGNATALKVWLCTDTDTQRTGRYKQILHASDSKHGERETQRITRKRDAMTQRKTAYRR
jgi:hypothetical protein